MEITKIPHTVKFGAVEGEFRGNDVSKLINPPIEVQDNYFWMRDDSRKSEQVIEHIKKENLLTDDYMLQHKNLHYELYHELKSYVQETYDTHPFAVKTDSFYKYFVRYRKDSGYPIYCSKNIITNQISELVDVNKLADGFEQCNVKYFMVSDNEALYSYCIDYNGSEKYELKIFGLINDVPKYLTTNFPPIPYAEYIWFDDNIIYYVLSDTNNRMCELWIYSFDDFSHQLLFSIKDNEEQKQYSLSIEKSLDKKYLFLKVGDYNSNYCLYINMEKDPRKLYLFNPFLQINKPLENENLQIDMIENTKYSLEHHNDCFYIKTNADKSTNWKIMIYYLESESLQEFIPYNKYINITNFITTKNYLIYSTVINGFSYINIVDYQKSNIKIINNINNISTSFNDYYNNTDFQKLSSENVYSIELASNLYDSDKITFSFDTMITPFSYFEYDVQNLSSTLIYTKEVPKYNQDLFECKRIYAPFSNPKDFESWPLGIPISLVYNKEKYDPKKSPLYLYGYGSYGITIEPSFNHKILPLLNRGWIYAIAHVRGGAFLGTEWYEDGRMNKKINSFTDFIDATEFLGNNYSDKNNITIEGRSAGGLLVGACLTMRPELYKNVIMGVPFVDVLNTMSDSTIPLTVEEWTQWGNPNVKEDHDYMKQYCPYTNIKENHYNNVFITAGLYDPRVPYWEPLKFIAKLKEFDTNKSENNKKLIKTELIQGHFGGSSRYKYLEEYAEKYTFILTVN